MKRYRIYKSANSSWCVNRTIWFTEWCIASFPTWTDALDAVNRRINRDRGVQADYALAAPGENR